MIMAAAVLGQRLRRDHEAPHTWSGSNGIVLTPRPPESTVTWAPNRWTHIALILAQQRPANTILG